MTPLQIVCPEPSHPLIRWAVEELQRYGRQFYGFSLG